MTEGFDTTPKPAFLRAMQNQKWGVPGALAELVDNSFGPGRGNATQVHITHDTKNRTIEVLDNGNGMSRGVGQLFQLGNTVGRTPGDIGIYGSGGTMALLWLSRKVQVFTLRDGEVNHDSVNWGDWIKRERFPVVSGDWKHSTLGNTPSDLYNQGHGVLVRIHLLNERSLVPSNIKRDLGRIYAPALRLGKKIIWTTIGKGGGTDQIADPLVLPDDPDNTVEFDLAIEINDELLGVHGVIGLVADLAQQKSVVSIGLGPRVITTTRDCYASPDGDERFVGAGVAGWLDLGEGWQPYLSTTKDSVNDRPVWDLLMAHVFEKIRPLLAKVDYEKVTIELIEIGIMLESVLDGRAHVDVTSASKLNPTDDEDKPLGPEEPSGEDAPDPQPSTPSDPVASDRDGEATNRKDPANARVEIIQMDDNAMGRLLCRAEASAFGVDVFVNKDHETVKEALIKRPVNRDLLHLMVVQQIANAISDDASLMRRVFPARLIRDLEEQDGRTREGIILRYLIDRVKRPKAA